MPAETDAREIPPISAVMLRFFERIVRAYFRRHFRAVMVQHGERFAEVRGPLIVYANHSSWWDPMVSVLLARSLMPGRKHYAPMDAAALARYPILRRIGIFAVEMGSARGAARFLRTSQAILAAGGVVWITPQGRFSDPREPSLGFKQGLGALTIRTTEATVLPLAIEYTFWDERLPETLLRFGEEVRIASGASTEKATLQLETALAEVMGDLKESSMTRDAGAFHVLLSGARGAGGFYGLGRRLRAFFSRKPLVLDHTERGQVPAPDKEQQ
jgi:1-acyl-sn-glycerol-3-phosphate acyltransferase